MKLNLHSITMPKFPLYLKVIFLIAGSTCEVLGLVWFYLPDQYDILSIVPIAIGLVLILLGSNFLPARVVTLVLGLVLFIVFLIQFLTSHMTQAMIPSLILGLILIFVGGGAELIQLIDNALVSI